MFGAKSDVVFDSTAIDLDAELLGRLLQALEAELVERLVVESAGSRDHAGQEALDGAGPASADSVGVASGADPQPARATSSPAAATDPERASWW